MRGHAVRDHANGAQGRRRLALPGLAAAVVATLGLSLLLAGCQSISGYTKSSLARIIDASYNAPALNVYIENTLEASNIGQGTITPYGGVGPSASAVIKITGTSSTNALASTSATLAVNQAQSVLISDLNAGYQITVLEDQSVPAPSGHSDFRILNQAPATGAIDVYFLAGTTTADYTAAKAVITSLAAGATSGYISIPSSTLYMVIAPTGTTLSATAKNIYVSAALPLAGGEVRTVLVLDPVLVTQPVQVFTVDDVD